LVGSGGCTIKVLDLHGGTEENHGKSGSGEPMSRMYFELRTSGIKVYSVTSCLNLLSLVVRDFVLTVVVIALVIVGVQVVVTMLIVF
jgi:hypothetical protein